MTDNAPQSEAFLRFETSTSTCTGSNMLNDIQIPLSPIVLEAYGSTTTTITTTATTTTVTDPLLCDNIDMPLSPRHCKLNQDDFISYYDTDLEVLPVKTEIFSRSNVVSNDPLLAMPLSEILNDFDTIINPVPLRDETFQNNLTEPPCMFRQKGAGADLEIYRPTTQAFAPLPLRTTTINNTNQCGRDFTMFTPLNAPETTKDRPLTAEAFVGMALPPPFVSHPILGTNHCGRDFTMFAPLDAPETAKDRPLTTEAFGGMALPPPFVSHPILGSPQRMTDGVFPIGSPQRKVRVPPRPTPVTPEPNLDPDNKEPLEWMARSLFQSHQNNRYCASQLLNWSQRYEEAKEYGMAHGHCIIPHEYVINPDLARWAKRQRCEYQIYTKRLKGKQDRKIKSSMSRERVQLLNAIGFCWCHNKSSWNLRYQELCTYYDKCNHTLVAPDENRKLAIWVKAQRRQFRLMHEGAKSSMTAERCDHLDKIGFVWRMNKVWKKPTIKGKEADA